MIFVPVCCCQKDLPFLCGISSRTKSAPAIFIYLFVCLQEWCARRVVSSLVSTWEDWALVGGHFFFQLLDFYWFWIFFCVVLLAHNVSRSRFPFWRFCWVFLSLNLLYKFKFWLWNISIGRRKSITFAFFPVISSVVYNRRSFCQRSCLALFTNQQSSLCTFRSSHLKPHIFDV